MVIGLWSQEEHSKFLIAIKRYPHGPWRRIAAYIGTRSIRQVQTHAQKYHEKVARRMRGLRKGRRSSGRREHRIDDDMLAACKLGEGYGVIRPNCIKSPLQHANIPVFDSTEPMVSLLLDSTPGSMSPGGVDSNGVADTVPTVHCTPSNASCQLPTIDESLDFLIENLSKALGGEDITLVAL
ncbi:unnamed protein product [Phytophthora lilii]|uniref:Unnamed protein product n=1 Tax=Phytophthora lilii TaxID=2077276 RepID=A0A9W6WHY8_9STRA|nr:unnamed protein product [Phytophthora lilii]